MCNCHEKKKHCCSCDKKKESRGVDMSLIQVITKRDFCEGGRVSKSVHIVKSGKYCLGANIPFAPVENKIAAIVIDADNVKLDLCGFVLEHVNQLSEITGIRVLTGHNNVTILGSDGKVTLL